MLHRMTPGTGYEPQKELREALLREQGYICAYCMRRIPTNSTLSNETSHIEHLKSRHNYPNLSMDYGNMVVCCPGDIEETPHCDRSKGDKELHFDLFSGMWDSTLSYGKRDGEIRSSDTNVQQDLCEVLNLNHARLKINRKATLDGVIEKLCQAQKNKKFKMRDIQHMLEAWQNKDESGKMRPYCGIVIWFLQKKLRQV